MVFFVVNCVEIELLQSKWLFMYEKKRRARKYMAQSVGVNHFAIFGILHLRNCCLMCPIYWWCTAKKFVIYIDKCAIILIQCLSNHWIPMHQKNTCFMKITLPICYQVTLESEQFIVFWIDGNSILRDLASKTFENDQMVKHLWINWNYKQIQADLLQNLKHLCILCT